VTFVIFWVGFGIYVARVGKLTNIYETGIFAAPAVEFPTFHYRMEGYHEAPYAIVTSSISCLWNNNVKLTAVQCAGFAPWNQSAGLAQCFAINPAAWGAVAYAYGPGNNTVPPLYSYPNFQYANIWCNFTVDLTKLNGWRNFVAWSLDGLSSYGYGDTGNAPIFFSNWDLNVVTVEQFLISSNPYYASRYVFIPPINNQNNTIGNNANYYTLLNVDTTTVNYYEQFSLDYHSWAALADIGGLAFGLVLMRIVVMILVGLLFDDDSTFLSGHHSHKGDTGGERTPIVH